MYGIIDFSSRLYLIDVVNGHGLSSSIVVIVLCLSSS